MFETLLVRDGRVQALDRHVARLGASVQALYAQALPHRATAEILARAREHDGSHRLRVCARPSADGLDIAVEIAPLDPALVSRPVVLRSVCAPGGHGPHKWIDRRALAAAGPDTPLLLDTTGEVLEAAWGNVWIREGERVLTPPADGRVLPGVTRARLLALAPTLGLVTAIEPLSVARLRAADEVFVTSSLRQAVPAALGGAPTPLSAMIAAAAATLAAADWA